MTMVFEKKGLKLSLSPQGRKIGSAGYLSIPKSTFNGCNLFVAYRELFGVWIVGLRAMAVSTCYKSQINICLV